jgi:hypothetical protein
MCRRTSTRFRSTAKLRIKSNRVGVHAAVPFLNYCSGSACEIVNAVMSIRGVTADLHDPFSGAVLNIVASPAPTNVIAPRYVKPGRNVPVCLLRYPTMRGAK